MPTMAPYLAIALPRKNLCEEAGPPERPHMHVRRSYIP
jgi:hypothetical protein